MKRTIFVTFALLLSGFVGAEDFSSLTPVGLTIKDVSESTDGYKVTGVSQNNRKISAFMRKIENSSVGTPDLKMVILNPNGSGKYFEIMVTKKGRVTPANFGNNKEKFLDKKYNVRVIIRESYFEINGNRYSNQSEIKKGYNNMKGMKLVVCQVKGAPPNALNELLHTFSQLNTSQIELMQGNKCD